MARDSLALIASRGHHRGRDLESEINILLPPEIVGHFDRGLRMFSV